MTWFRVYIVGADGHYTGRTDFESSIDEAALKYAKQLANGRAVELWEGPRFIARLDGKPPTRCPMTHRLTLVVVAAAMMLVVAVVLGVGR